MIISSVLILTQPDSAAEINQPVDKVYCCFVARPGHLQMTMITALAIGKSEGSGHAVQWQQVVITTVGFHSILIHPYFAETGNENTYVCIYVTQSSPQRGFAEAMCHTDQDFPKSGGSG
jgi:hypothetical protein